MKYCVLEVVFNKLYYDYDVRRDIMLRLLRLNIYYKHNTNRSISNIVNCLSMSHTKIWAN